MSHNNYNQKDIEMGLPLSHLQKLRVGGTHSSARRRGDPSETHFSLSSFSLLVSLSSLHTMHVSRTLPLDYKRGGRAPL
jgi:hypothetical protein